jgi:hypothetical protein
MSERYGFDPDDEDVDLDVEDVRLKDGRRLTNELAEQIAEEAYQAVRRPGRPSLSGKREVSPVVSFRIPEQLRTIAEQRAQQEGRSVSELARDALIDYLRG